MLTKQCITCGKIKDESEFDFRRDRQKLRGQCRACRCERQKKYYRDHPEAREERNKREREKLLETSPKENYMLRDSHGRFLVGHEPAHKFPFGNKINLGKKITNRIYPEKGCSICGLKFRPVNGIQETCSRECKTQRKRHRERRWEVSNNEKRNIQDVVRSKNIQNQWTAQSGKWWWLSDIWKIAEERALDILRLEGYDNIELWTAQAARFPFDISASKDGKEYLFQVTTNLTAKKTAAHKFAIRYGFIHKILYISVETNRYVIKDFPKCGANRLTIKDVGNALTFV